MTEDTTTPAPSEPVAGPVQRPVRRLLDDERDDECPRCHGDGMDPWNDYLLPCQACEGDDL